MTDRIVKQEVQTIKTTTISRLVTSDSKYIHWGAVLNVPHNVVSEQAVRNGLHEGHLRARRPSPVLTAQHHTNWQVCSRCSKTTSGD